MRTSTLLLLSLATWRLSSLLAREDGPFDVFWRIRARAGVYREGELSGLAKGISCVWCVSVWTAALLLAGLRFAPSATRLVVAITAPSAGAILADSLVRLAKD